MEKEPKIEFTKKEIEILFEAMQSKRRTGGGNFVEGQTGGLRPEYRQRVDNIWNKLSEAYKEIKDGEQEL